MAKKSKVNKKKPAKQTKKAAAKVKKPAKKVSKKKSATKKAAAKKSTAKKAVSKAAAPAKVSAPKKAVSKAAAPAKVSAPKKAIEQTSVSPSSHPWVGKDLPEFTLENQSGAHINLGEVAKSNSKVVLYFYPKDDTPGCTTEACGFRDNFSRVEALGTKVLGVSPDTAESHQKFINKYNLNFDLLADTDHKLAEALGVWKLKKFMGREYMGIERSTFLIHNGNVVKAWQPVKVEGHVDEVINEAEKIS